MGVGIPGPSGTTKSTGGPYVYHISQKDGKRLLHLTIGGKEVSLANRLEKGVLAFLEEVEVAWPSVDDALKLPKEFKSLKAEKK